MALALKMLPAIVFIKRETNDNSLEIFSQEIINLAYQQRQRSFAIEMIDQICLVLVKFYLLLLLPLLNRPPIFPTKIGNQREAAIGRMVTTTNGVVGWPSRITWFNGSHPCTLKICD